MTTINRKKLGYLPEDRGLYQKQNLSEILYYFGCLKGLDKKDSKNQSDLWLERFYLDDQKGRKIEELSKGNQQKIQFILALIHDPELIILDEPFTGLDPLNQLLMKEIIQEKQNEGRTIIFSTHQMEQVEKLIVPQKFSDTLFVPFEFGNKKAWLHEHGVVVNEFCTEVGFRLDVIWSAQQKKKYYSFNR